MTNPTIECPRCGKTVNLKPNGITARHTGKTDNPANPYFKLVCPGNKP